VCSAAISHGKEFLYRQAFEYDGGTKVVGLEPGMWVRWRKESEEDPEQSPRAPQQFRTCRFEEASRRPRRKVGEAGGEL
jgi:hypothetical protein